MSRQAGLLNQDLLILQQFRGGLSPEFDVVSANGGGVVAQASRERVGFAKAFLGYDRYALRYPAGTSPDRRLAILGGMIALDLMRDKSARSAAINGT